jgi:hypothetical protein
MNQQFTAEENFIIESARKVMGAVQKGRLKLTWLHQRGRYMVQWFVRGRLVEAAALTAEGFLQAFRRASHWIIPEILPKPDWLGEWVAT